MTDHRALLEQTRDRFPEPSMPVERIYRARDRRRRSQRVAAGVVGLAIAVAAIVVGSSVVRSGDEPPHVPASQLPTGRIALPTGDTVMLLDPRTGDRSEVNLRTGAGGYTVSGFTWAPDGTKFAYVTEQQATVRVVDLGTNTISTIVPCGSPAPYHPGCARFVAWSPDGSRIAVSGGGGLELMDLDGSHRTTLLMLRPAQDGYVGPATWSADGRSLAFAASLPGYRDLQAIYEVNADGSHLRPLFEQPGSGAVAGPRWSPDGSTIAYLVAAHGPGFDHTPAPPIVPQVWLVDADGSHPRELFEGGACCSGGTWTGLSWSPDGTEIAFIGTPPGSAYGTRAPRLYAIDPAGGPARVIAPHVPLGGPPAWQPGSP
jgi:WD40 repeat protein